MKSNVMFRPTMILGLGGTGHNVLLRLKRHFIDSFDFVPPCISFLSIDVSEPETEALPSGDGKIMVSLDQNIERFVIQVPNPANLVGETNPHIYQWWPKNTLVSAITSGATQIRPRGRLALFAKYPDIHARVLKAIERVRDAKTINEMYYRDLQRSERAGIDVYIVSSLAGGTGSGMVLDMAFIIRDLLDASSNITGMLVLPRVFNNDPGIRQKPNSYAALKELEFFMKIRQGEIYTINYGGDTPVRVKQPPFDLVYLADAINEERNSIRDIEQLFANIAHGLYIQMGSQIGTKNNNAMDNIKGKLTAIGRIEGRSAAYCSFGVASIVLPVEMYKREFEARKTLPALSLLDALLNGDSPKVKPVQETSKESPTGNAPTKVEPDEEPLNIVYGQRLQSNLGEFLAESLVQLKEGGTLSFNMHISSLIEEKRSKVQAEALTIYNNSKRRMASAAASTVKNNYEQLHKDFLKRLGEWWDKTINSVGGLTYTETTIEKLKQEFEAGILYLQGEQSAAQHQLKEINRELEEVRKTLEKATSPWQLLGAGAAIGNACQKYAEVAHREFDLYVKMESRGKAAELLGKFKEYATEQETQCKAIRNTLEDARKKFDDTPPKEKDIQRSKNPFERMLPFVPKALEVGSIEFLPSEFLKWYKKEFDSFSAIGSTTSAEVADRVRQYVNENFGTLPAHTIDSVLEVMDAEERRQYFRHLFELAAPLWSFDESNMALPHKTIMEASYFGVEDPEGTNLRQFDGELASTNTAPSFIKLLDPHCITHFRVRAGIPLFILEGIGDMEHAYYDQDDIASNHIDYRWKTFPDIIPLRNKTMSRRQQAKTQLLFAIAQAQAPFELIKVDQGSFNVHLDETPEGQNNGLFLGAGWHSAFLAFESNTELVQKVKEKVKDVIQKKEKPIIRVALQSLVDNLRDQYSGERVDFELAGLIESEIVLIEEFIDRLEATMLD